MGDPMFGAGGSTSYSAVLSKARPAATPEVVAHKPAVAPVKSNPFVSCGYEELDAIMDRIVREGVDGLDPKACAQLMPGTMKGNVFETLMVVSDVNVSDFELFDNDVNETDAPVKKSRKRAKQKLSKEQYIEQGDAMSKRELREFIESNAPEDWLDAANLNVRKRRKESLVELYALISVGERPPNEAMKPRIPRNTAETPAEQEIPATTAEIVNETKSQDVATKQDGTVSTSKKRKRKKKGGNANKDETKTQNDAEVEVKNEAVKTTPQEKTDTKNDGLKTESTKVKVVKGKDSSPKKVKKNDSNVNAKEVVQKAEPTKEHSPEPKSTKKKNKSSKNKKSAVAAEPEVSEPPQPTGEVIVSQVPDASRVSASETDIVQATKKKRKRGKKNSSKKTKLEVESTSVAAGSSSESCSQRLVRRMDKVMSKPGAKLLFVAALFGALLSLGMFMSTTNNP